ncbi:hypothetical protein [Bacillus sp. FJAT-27445]|uniref:hypothetical protein n=1 Tax=Bacillus sp. FJAT-27445 TaxID=1679166 RepID=UPI000743D38F|nr:hypothetical protein [Bacillus sp. FJAT-27445]
MIINTRSSDERKVILVACTIIMYISSFFVPVVIVASIHSTFYFKREYWFFETPSSAYLAFMAGMFLSAVLLTLYLIAAWKWENKKLGAGLIALQVFCVPLFVGSIDNYYFATDKGIFYNKLAGIGEKKYAWKDMESVKLVYRHSRGSVRFDSYSFISKSGETVSLPYTSKLREKQWLIEEMIKVNHLTVSDNYDDPIMD